MEIDGSAANSSACPECGAAARRESAYIDKGWVEGHVRHQPRRPRPAVPAVVSKTGQRRASSSYRAGCTTLQPTRGCQRRSTQHPKADDSISGRVRYTTVKLVNLLWMYQLVPHLAAEVPDRQITVTAFDPGMMPGTGLARNRTAIEQFACNTVLPNILPVLRLFFSKNTQTLAESGAALSRLAVGEDVQEEKGVYYEGRKPRETSKASHDEAKQEDLW
ncbi:hypothetical protein PWT90_07982 [Aphanocladium album]|nr:hypothetical protein PWT90_07982 [Aphanocladium album]